LIEDIADALGADLPAAVSEALQSVRDLYKDTTIGEIWPATKDLKIYDIADELADIVIAADENLEKYADLAVGIIKDIITEDSTVSHVAFNELLTVLDVYDIALRILEVFEVELPESVWGLMDIVFDDIYGGVRLAHFAEEAKEATLDIEVAPTIEKIAGLFDLPEVAEEVVQSLLDLYGNTKVRDFVETTLDLRIYDIVDELAEIVITANAGTEPYVEIAVEIIKEIIAEESIVRHIVFNKDTTVGEVYGTLLKAFDLAGLKLPEQVRTLMDIVFDDIYGEVKFSNFAEDAWEATKDIEIVPTLKEILSALGVDYEYEAYDLFKDADGYFTVRDFVENAEETLNKLIDNTDIANGIGKMNEVLADLYFRKDFEDTNTAEKAAIYGTYVAAGVLMYFFAYDKLHDALDGMTIADLVAPASLANGNEDLESLLEELFDTELTSFLETIHGDKAWTELLDEIFEDIRVGDVVAAFTKLTDNEGWKFGEAEMGRIISEFADIYLNEISDVIINGKAFEEIYGYKTFTIDNLGEAVYDVAEIVDAYIPYLEAYAGIVKDLGNLAADTFVERDSLIIAPKAKDVIVSGLVAFADGVLDIFAPEVIESNVYKGTKLLVTELIGEAYVIYADPFKVTGEDVKETFLNDKISLVTATLEEALEIYGAIQENKLGNLIANTLDELTELYKESGDNVVKNIVRATLDIRVYALVDAIAEALYTDRFVDGGIISAAITGEGNAVISEESGVAAATALKRVFKDTILEFIGVNGDAKVLAEEES
ncbi:MAG: hypothetical protein IKS76_02565, partial [Paludibacteraceae bacterium]|nr:hypothetical protein [Paludibacteraceae bacterium]